MANVKYTVLWHTGNGEGDGYLINNWNVYKKWFVRGIHPYGKMLFSTKALATRTINRIKALNWEDYANDTFEIKEVIYNG